MFSLDGEKALGGKGCCDFLGVGKKGGAEPQKSFTVKKKDKEKSSSERVIGSG